MDNKKWSKRYSTIFWWVLAFLPLFACLIHYLGYNFAHLNAINDISEIKDYYNQYRGFSDFLVEQFSGDNSFTQFIPFFIINMFTNLFTLIIGNGVSFSDYSHWCFLFGWAFWIFIVHVIFDLIIWLPCFLHELIDRFKK